MRSKHAALLCRISTVLSAAAIASSCNGGGGSGSELPANSTVVGSWSGSVSTSYAGSGTLSLDIDVVNSRASDSSSSDNRGNQTLVSGTYGSDVEGQNFDEGGTFEGVFADGVLTGTLDSYFYAGCTFAVNALVTENSISGSFQTSGGCPLVASADFDLDPVSNDTPDITGYWSGEIFSSAAGAGTFVASIDQTGLNFTGELQTDFSGSANDSVGYLFGTIGEISVLLFGIPDPLECANYIFAELTLVDDSLSGTFANSGDCQPVSGELSLIRN